MQSRPCLLSRHRRHLLHQLHPNPELSAPLVFLLWPACLGLQVAWCWHPGWTAGIVASQSTVVMIKMTKTNFNRREFLKLTAVGVAVAAGTRAITSSKASSNTPKGKHQWAMVIDQSKCIGCGYCTLACKAHNDINPDIE